MSGLQRVATYTKSIRSVPVIAAATYTTLDQLGGINTLEKACLQQGAATKLVGLVLRDLAAQDALIDVFFFRVSPTMVGVDEAAFDILDANADAFIGRHEIAVLDYDDVGSATWSYASYTEAELGQRLVSATAQGDLFYVLRVTGTPTYAVGSIELEFIFEQGAQGNKERPVGTVGEPA